MSFFLRMGGLPLLVALAACSKKQDDTGSTPEPFELEPTAVGEAIGVQVEGSVDGAGGSLVSSDGILTLVVPPGAVPSATDFGIQVITNESYASIGNAYRLTSTADSFDVPVELHFAYTDDDLDSTEPAALGVAYRDARGFWLWQESVVLDEGDQEIVLSTDHFTDFSRVRGWQLRANRYSVEFGGATDVRLVSCVVMHDNGDEAQTLLAVYDCENASATQPDDAEIVALPPAQGSSWAVNGAPGGTNGDGLVTLGSGTETTYTAPYSEPTSNPVAVSVESATGGLMVTHIYVGDPVWRGNSEVLVVYDPLDGFTRTVRATATDVTWIWDSSSQAYTPTGTVNYDIFGTYPIDDPPVLCEVTAHYSGPANEGQLIILDAGDGVLTYFGGGYVSNVPITETDSCGGDTTLPTYFAWWLGFRPPADDPFEQGKVTEWTDGTQSIEQTVTFHSTGATQTNSFRFELR